MLVRMASLADSDSVPVILVAVFVVRIAHATKGRLDVLERSKERELPPRRVTDVDLQSSARAQILAG